MPRCTRTIVLTALALTLPVASASARTLYVDDTRNQCPNARYTAIQPAVDDASPGDEVKVCAGTYAQGFDVDKAVKVVSTPRHAATVIHQPPQGLPDNFHDAVTLSAGASLQGFRIVGLPHLPSGRKVNRGVRAEPRTVTRYNEIAGFAIGVESKGLVYQNRIVESEAGVVANDRATIQANLIEDGETGVHQQGDAARIDNNVIRRQSYASVFLWEGAAGNVLRQNIAQDGAPCVDQNERGVNTWKGNGCPVEYR